MDKNEALDVALGQIERAFGKGSVMKMSDRAAVAKGGGKTPAADAAGERKARLRGCS